MALWRLVEYFKWHCGHFEYLLHDRLVGNLLLKRQKDMLWPDMTWCFILAYDIWNFQYTYLNLPTHSWYCGFALLLAPTVANALWNKGGWIQNRANTLALWCMFAQVFPLFQDGSRFTTVSAVYGEGGAAAALGEAMPATANPTAHGNYFCHFDSCEPCCICSDFKTCESTAQKSVHQRNIYRPERFSDGNEQSGIIKIVSDNLFHVIRLNIQNALYEQAPSSVLYIQFCMAELLQINCII